MTRTPPPNPWRREPPQGWQEMERRAAAQAREFSRRGAPAPPPRPPEPPPAPPPPPAAPPPPPPARGQTPRAGPGAGCGRLKTTAYHRNPRTRFEQLSA